MQTKRQFKVMEPLASQHGGSHLRFRGKWLAAAGFHPGMTVEVTTISPGVMELRVVDAAQFSAADFTAAIAAFQKVGL